MSIRRVNGFQRPFNRYQIYSWSLFPVIIVHYFGLLFPFLGSITAQVIVTLIFLICFISALLTGYYSCYIDPCDDALLLEDTAPPENDNNDENVYCYLCETNVDITSKHCRYCDKCIVGFDHHCV